MSWAKRFRGWCSTAGRQAPCDPLRFAPMSSGIAAQYARQLSESQLRPGPQGVESRIGDDEFATISHPIVVIAGIAISQR